jgi:hypothetical protein
MDHRVVRGQVIHVNEDGWVVINRGMQDGVVEGQKFVVLGERNPRQIHNLYPEGAENSRAPQPAVLRVDTAYELLRVILVERECCVAISDRVPQERTPQPFLGPQGELLLYTPPPSDWRFDALDLQESQAEPDTEDEDEGEADEDQAEAGDDAAGERERAEASEDAEIDPNTQQDRLWDGALPLNALQVGDEVVLAQPYVPGAVEREVWAASNASSIPAEAAPASSSVMPSTPESYDWFKTS